MIIKSATFGKKTDANPSSLCDPTAYSASTCALRAAARGDGDLEGFDLCRVGSRDVITLERSRRRLWSASTRAVISLTILAPITTAWLT